MSRISKPRYLEQRRRRWYAVLDIPKDVRHCFEGKPRFVKSLGTESISEAQRLVLPVIARWKAEIVAARSGSLNPLRELALAQDWGREFREMEDDKREFALELIDDKVADIDYRDPASAKVFHKIATGASWPLGGDIDAWLNRSDNEPKTIDMQRRDVQRFAERFPFSHQVTRKALVSWVEDLGSNDGLSDATIQRIISACRQYCEYLCHQSLMPPMGEVFSGLVQRRTKGKAKRVDGRKPFSPAEVVALLNAATESDRKLAQLIWVAMWTGCRIEEICALKIENVKKDRLEILDAKTDAGERTVPIHSRLAPLIGHLAATTSDGFLLSGLTENKYGDRSNAIGKRFGRLKCRLGFGKGQVFHSIRMTVATELENAMVSENIAADILGHKKLTMSYGVYSGGAHLSVKLDAIERLDYPTQGTPSLLL